jgi:hypothetical protein
MIYLKFITPGNYYSHRKVKVTAKNGVVNFLSSNENLLLHINDYETEYQLKLDYHKLTFITKTIEINKDYFFIVYFNYRPFLPLFFLDLMFKNSLRIREVSDFEFKHFTQQNFLVNETSFLKRQNPGVKRTIYLCIINGIIQSFVLFDTPNKLKSHPILFVCTIISLISMFGFFSIKKITLIKFFTRILSYLIFSLFLIFELGMYSMLTSIILILVFSALTAQLFILKNQNFD